MKERTSHAQNAALGHLWQSTAIDGHVVLANTANLLPNKLINIIKGFLKPNALKIIVFLFIGIFYLYFAGESACGVWSILAFCYKAYGFPFSYIATGDIEIASGYIKNLFLGENFIKSGNLLFNPMTLALDLILIYLLACFISMLVKNIKTNIKN